LNTVLTVNIVGDSVESKKEKNTNEMT
jgi:hypothetical protein